MFDNFCGDELNDRPVSCPVTLGSYTPVPHTQPTLPPIPSTITHFLVLFLPGYSSQCIVHQEHGPCFWKVSRRINALVKLPFITLLWGRTCCRLSITFLFLSNTSQNSFQPHLFDIVIECLTWSLVWHGHRMWAEKLCTLLGLAHKFLLIVILHSVFYFWAVGLKNPLKGISGGVCQRW